MAWLHNEFQVCILEMSIKHIHSYIRHITGKCFYLTLVYGTNDDEERLFYGIPCGGMVAK